MLAAVEEAVRMADEPVATHPQLTDLQVGRPNHSKAVRGVRPNVRAGQSIDAYSQRELVEMVRWISSDTLLRTDEELLTEVMRELGFLRRGTKILAKIGTAVREFRPNTTT